MKKILFASVICLACYNGFSKNASVGIVPAKDSVLENPIVSKVKITSFEATVKGSSITCKWITALEINNNYFELERSFDGVNFKVTALVFGAEGSSNTDINYHFKDDNEALKRNDFVYYRLKQIGNDSMVQYSQLIKVALSKSSTSALGVVPNPFASNFTYNLNAPAAGFVITKIINLGGRLVAIKHTPVNKGINNLAIDDVAEFSSGVYIMEVMMNGSIIGRQKITKG